MAESTSRPAPNPPEKPSPSPESMAVLFERELGVSHEEAQRLVDAGFTTVAEVRSANRDRLVSLGFPEATVTRLIQGKPGASGGDELLEKWLESRARRSPSPRVRKRPIASNDSGSQDLVKKWMAGESLEVTLEGGTPPGPSSSPSAPTEARGGTSGALPSNADPTASPSPPPLSSFGTPAPPAPDLAAAALQEVQQREETVLRWLSQMLERAKKENFDPAQLLSEARDLSRELHRERARRRQLEEELEHVKKGSVAVIKYVRSREARAREEALQARDAEILQLRRQLESARAALNNETAHSLLQTRDARIQELEAEIERLRSEAGSSQDKETEMASRFQDELAEKTRQAAEREAELKRRIIELEEALQHVKDEQDLAAKHSDLARMSRKELTAELKARVEQLEAREKALTARETELKVKMDELLAKADEIEGKRAPLAYKEAELSKREEELRIREEKVRLELRQLEQQRQAGVDPAGAEKLQRLEDISAEIGRKEEELRARETYLKQRLEELELKERGLAEAEVARAETERQEELAQNKVRTGIPRLDDLLFGGLPLGTNVLVNGPAHTGKEVMARLLAAEGLKKGVPVLWVLSDKATQTVREEMRTILPAYPEYEKKDLVRYVDLYSMSLGITQADRLVTLLSVDDKGLLEKVAKAVDDAAQEFKAHAPYYRLIFESLSTVTAYLDASNTFRFLQPFTGRRKLDHAVAYYLIDTGMHGESDIQTLQHMMDGSINLKMDQLKTYLSVQGIGEVQSRAWIAYTFTKKVFNIGSFSLDHIR